MPIRDLTTFTEVDPNSKLTVTSTRVTAVNLDRDETVHITNDEGADAIDELDVTWEFLIDSNSVTDGGRITGPGFADVADSCTGFESTGCHIEVRDQSVGVVFVELIRGDHVANDVNNTLDFDTLYYGHIERAAGNNTITAKLYSDSGHTTLIDTLTVTGFSGAKWRYLYAMANRDGSSGGQDADGYLQNLNMPLPPVPFIARMSIF